VAVVFLGVDWAEEHHDVCLLDEQGKVLGRARVANSLEGVSRIHALVADHSEEPDAVVVGIETDRGLLVQALLAAGYQIYAINPLAVDRYRDRHSVSGAKSDAADAKVLADLVRTDRNNHRPVAGDSQQVEAVKLLARAHQALVHTRQRQINQLRSALREFYPAALEAFKDDLGGRDAVAILEYAPTPTRGRSVSKAKLISALRTAGRERNLEARAVELYTILHRPQLEQPATLVLRMGSSLSPAYRSFASSMPKRRHWNRSSRILLSCTRTPSSTSACQDSVLSSAPGLSVSSGMTRTAT
jgi:transposase